MEVVQLKAKTIKGFSIRTNNTDEMNVETAKIGRLWQKLDDTVAVDYMHGDRVYGVYYNYESDASGEFSVTAGFDGDEKLSKEKLELIELQAGNYLVFSATGEMPKIVIDTWMEIWGYFSSEACEHTRLFTTDFEFYKSQNEIEIHIAVE
ncbi:MAG: GyrI-like domain-containing protein [Cocleimonas sp.]|nr:GyrI-like domain-containing protein [Cocleimonas sp.]